jgi:hypothetical protein
MKHSTFFLMVAFWFCSMDGAWAQTVTSGVTGDCLWRISETQEGVILTVGGNGAMADYSSGAPWASFGSSIRTVVIEPGVTVVGDWAFGNCIALTSVTIPPSVTTIGTGAFRNCSALASVTIPSSVTTVGDRVFAFCLSLTGIEVDARNERFCSGEGVLFNKLKDTLVQYPAGRMGEYVIPASVKTIAAEAFVNAGGLRGVTIPPSVTTVGEAAFFACNALTSVTIPSSVTVIGDGSFGHCRGLTEFRVDTDNVAFCAVEGVLFSKSQEWLLRYPAGRAGSYVIPGSVTGVGSAAFQGCDALTEVTIPPSVTLIGNLAFSGCSALRTVTVGRAVTAIGNRAFEECFALSKLRVKTTIPPAMSSSVFQYVPATVSVLVPCGTLEGFRSASGWSSFDHYSEESPFLLSVGSGDPGMGSVEARYSNVCAGDGSVTVEAVAVAGYRFLQWQEDGDTVNPRVVALTQDTVFTALFARNPEECFLVTVEVNDVAMGSVRGGGLFAVNEQVEIRAIPGSGYNFVRWEDGVTANPRTVTVEGDGSYTAVFGYWVTLRVNSFTAGSVRGEGAYEKDEEVVIEAIPDEGYRFMYWNDMATVNPRTVTVEGRVTYTAYFGTDASGNEEVMASDGAAAVLYPNPVRSRVYVRSDVPVERVLIYTPGGRLVKVLVSPGREMDVSDLSQGLYFVRLFTVAGQEMVWRLVKE